MNYKFSISLKTSSRGLYRRMTLAVASHVLQLHVFIDDNVRDSFFRNAMTVFAVVLAVESHLQRTPF